MDTCMPGCCLSMQRVQPTNMTRHGNWVGVVAAQPVHKDVCCAHQGRSEGFLIDASGFSSNRFICLRSVRRLSKNVTTTPFHLGKHGRRNKANSGDEVVSREEKKTLKQSWHARRRNSPSACCPDPLSIVSTALSLRPHPPVHAALVSSRRFPGTC